MKPRSTKKSLRDTLRENQRGLDHYALLYGKPQTQHIAVKPKRERKASVKSEIPWEHEEQKNFVSWFRKTYKGIRIFAIPNAARRSLTGSAWLIAEGMTAGVPDLYIPEWKLWIEFKRIKGSTTSDEQVDWAEYLTQVCGDHHFFAFGCEDAKQKIAEHNAQFTSLYVL